MTTVTLNYTLVLEVDETLMSNNSFGLALDAGIARIKESDVRITAGENGVVYDGMAELITIDRGFIKALREIG